MLKIFEDCYSNLLSQKFKIFVGHYEYSVTSNSVVLKVVVYGRSFIYKRNNNVPEVNPCCTAVFIFSALEIVLLIEVY